MKNKKLLASVVILTIASLTLVGCSSKIKTTDVAKTPITADPTITAEPGSVNKPKSIPSVPKNILDASDVRNVKSTNLVIKTASEFADYVEKNNKNNKDDDAYWVDYLNTTFIPANKAVTITNNGNTNITVVYFSDTNTKACTIISLDEDLKDGHFVVVTGKNFKVCTAYEAIFKKPAPKIK